MKHALLGIAVISVAAAFLQTKPAHAQMPDLLQVNVKSAVQEKLAVTALPLLPGDNADTKKPETVAVETKAPEPLIVVVAEGDTLSKIAEKHGTTYKRLYDANAHIADPDIIKPQDKITIPAPDAQLPDRPLPQRVVVPVAQPQAAAAPYVPKSKPAASAPVYSAGQTVWDQLAKCESSGNWAINTGNGYYGGLQFTLSTWRAVGGSGYPHEHSREEQIHRAEILLARSGWGQWPACTAKLGLR